jgi:predicted DNA-binding transcriptional regulator AlpA
MKTPSEPKQRGAPLLRERQVLQLIPVSRATFHRWLRKGMFPKGYRLTRQIVVWRLEVVLDWIDRHVQPFEGKP